MSQTTATLDKLESIRRDRQISLGTNLRGGLFWPSSNMAVRHGDSVLTPQRWIHALEMRCLRILLEILYTDLFEEVLSIVKEKKDEIIWTRDATQRLLKDNPIEHSTGRENATETNKKMAG